MIDFDENWINLWSGITDIHLTFWQNEKLIIQIRKEGKVSYPSWPEDISKKIWFWCLWHAALLQENMQETHHRTIWHEKITIRISYSPMMLGQRMVLRLHQNIQENLVTSCPLLTKAGLSIFYGKTGSGKTTRAYQILNQASSKLIAISIEDPPEALNLSWPQFDKKIFKNPNEIHHLVLRQNPDILFWGELRDKTAWKFIENWATTGQHVITTVHADDYKELIDRLLLLGASKKFLEHYLKFTQYCPQNYFQTKL